jgi:hypothetical protein
MLHARETSRAYDPAHAVKASHGAKESNETLSILLISKAKKAMRLPASPFSRNRRF